LLKIIVNSQDRSNLQQRLQELEAQIPTEATSGQRLEPNLPINSDAAATLPQIANWFHNLPDVLKIVAIALAAVLSFTLLRTVLQLVFSLITLAIVGGLVYFAYKFWVAPQPFE
jgi:hypothetical protein